MRCNNPVNTRHSINVVLMLGQRRRRWANIKTTLIECVMLTGRHCNMQRVSQLQAQSLVVYSQYHDGISAYMTTWQKLAQHWANAWSSLNVHWDIGHYRLAYTLDVRF